MSHPSDAYDLLRQQPQTTVDPPTNFEDRIQELEQKIEELDRKIDDQHQLLHLRQASSKAYKNEITKHFWSSSAISFLMGAQCGILLVSLLSFFRKK